MKMGSLSALLVRADEGLRALLTGRRWPAWLPAAATAAAFFLLMLTRTFAQLEGASGAVRALSALTFCLPLLLMLRFGLVLLRSRSCSLLEQLLVCALCAAAMLARVSFIDRSSGDFDIYLADWLNRLAAGSFGEGMKADIGEYNVLYQYILFLITRLPVPQLYAVKCVSFIGDALLAGAAAHLGANGKKGSLAAFAAALLLPTLILNGGMFAQCDSLYAACALWGLVLSLKNKPMRAAACFALALSFKLQSAFILPVVVVLWADRKLTLREGFVFLLTLLTVALPALLGGKSLMKIIGIYTAQTGIYTGLTYNAATMFGLFDTTGLDVYAYGNFGMAIAVGVCALLMAAGVRRRGKMTDGDYVQLSLLMVLLIVFFLPRMHERYFYMAVPLSAALASRRGGKCVIAAALVELAMLATHWETAITLPAASLMMLCAAVIVIACGEDVCVREKDVI